MKVYFAGPLFTDAERAFNKHAAEELTKLGCDVFLPQDVQIDFDQPNWQSIIFQRDHEEIDAADVVIAVLDGCLVDDGTAWEVGYAYAHRKPIIGIHTDIRTVGVEGKVNLMVEKACAVICSSDWGQVVQEAKELFNGT